MRTSLLEQHEDVYEDAILIKVHSFLKTTDFPESLGIAEDLNFRIMDIVQGAGTQFALPGKLIYMEEQETS